ncbi:uncharacterized protein TNCV_4519271 [Trichonephila clavipes]|nr:uncharacterized protein TNCV_4519271 [Trichonephila clavipes]
MFGFPKEDFLRNKWIQAISRKDYAPSKYSKIMSNYMELDETAKARYDEKLSCNGNKLPDPFDQSTMEHCSFRLGEVCSHVAALLFAVEMANNKESPAPTSVACMWNKTSKKVDPVQVSAINFSRKRKCKQKVFKKSKLPSEEAYKTFLEAIKEHNPDAPYLEHLTDEEETSSASETEHQEENHLLNLIELLRTKFSGMLKHVRADDSIHSMLLDCSLSHETIQNIELSTRDQASSAMWNHQRKGRVTFSLFGKILHCKTGQKGLVEQIFGMSFSNAAIDWGKNQEAVAKQQFLTYLSDQHVNGMLLPCGLLVHKENIFLGATPDGLVMCDCCETALLEIKCPA